MGAFSIFSDKKRRRTAGEPPETEQNYYELLGRRLNRLKYLLLFALIIFVAGGFTFYSDLLNIDNFRYMLKFLSIDMDTEIVAGDTIEFDPAPGTRALIVNGDLVIADSNGIQIFDMSGERFLRERDFMNDAMCAVSGNNLLVCDRGTQTLSAYTVYARIYTYTAEYPIYGLCSAKTGGRYALLTAANGYRSGIEVYDGEFRMLFRYYFADRYISCIAISPDGNRAAACTVNNTAAGDYCGELYAFDPENDESLFVIKLEEEIPWQVEYRQNGDILLLTNRTLRLIGTDGTEKARVSHAGETVKGCCLTDGICSLAYDTAGLSNGTTVKFFDPSLNPLGGVSYRSDVSRTDIAGGKAYICTGGSLHVFDIAAGEEIAEEDAGTDYICMLEDAPKDRLIMIFRGKAVFRDSGANAGKPDE